MRHLVSAAEKLRAARAASSGTGDSSVQRVSAAEPGGMSALCRRWFWPGVMLLGAIGSAAVAEEPDQDAKPPAQARRERTGTLIRIRPPLSEATQQRVVQMARSFIQRAAQQEKQPVIVFQLSPGDYSFGEAYDLAESILQLSGALTVAYLPHDYQGRGQVLRGHGVLIALACDQIYLGPECRIGEAGAGSRSIPAPVRSAYVDIARRRRTVPVALALGMLDPAVEVWEVQTTELVRRFVLREELEELEKKTTIVKPKQPLVPRGEAALFTAREAVRLGIAYVAEDRAALARALHVPESELQEDLSLGGGWRGLLVRVDEQISARFASRIQHRVRTELRRRDVNLLIWVIDSPGGEIDPALQLASFIAELDDSRYRTVAVVTHEALGPAALVALSCDQLLVHPDAQLGGGVGSVAEDPGQLAAVVEQIRSIMQRKQRPYSLAVALVDPQTVVYEFRRKSDGHRAYFSEAEWQELPRPDQWERGPAITQQGTALKLTGREALRYAVAAEAIQSLDELPARFGIEDELPEVEFTWLDVLLDALTNEAVLWGLLLLGGISLYIELQTPGIGIGAAVATVCFLLYFWGNYLGGTVGWLEVVLFLCGLVFLLLEIFVFPGFGVFGLLGGLMVLASLVLALVTLEGFPRSTADLLKLRHALVVVVSAVLGMVVAIALIRRWLPHTPGVSRIMLEPPSEEERRQIQQRELLARYDHLLGKRGKTTTPLVPSGKARFGEQLVNVISETGDLIEAGQEVEVVRVQGVNIWVRPVA